MPWIAANDTHVPDIIALWQVCGLTRPWNDPAQDIAFARKGPDSDVLVHVENECVIAAVMVGHDGHRGAVYYAGVHPYHQRTGLGRAMMEAAEDWLRARGVWKLNLMVRDSNDQAAGFYASLGYEDQHCRVMGKRLDGRPDRT